MELIKGKTLKEIIVEDGKLAWKWAVDLAVQIARGLEKAPNGIIGFETALPATITNLVAPGHISYLDMVRLMSYNPAKLLGIGKGEIREGAIADLTIFDANKKYVYKATPTALHHANREQPND